jgi:hypothetical protein
METLPNDKISIVEPVYRTPTVPRELLVQPCISLCLGLLNPFPTGPLGRQSCVSLLSPYGLPTTKFFLFAKTGAIILTSM